jgi:hypothetical protein
MTAALRTSGAETSAVNENKFTAINSTFYNNRAGGNGGVAWLGASAAKADNAIVDCTLAGNVAAAGGGIYTQQDAAGVTVVMNSIVLGNYTGGNAAADIDDINGTMDIAYSIYAALQGSPLANVHSVVSDTETEFGAGWQGGKLVAVDGGGEVFDGRVIPVLKTGNAATLGALAGYIPNGGDKDWFYYDNRADASADRLWKSFTSGTTKSFDKTGGSNFGLGGGAVVISGSQNGPSRTNVVTMFSIGAYVIAFEMPSTVVTMSGDIVDITDGKISLREAIMYSTLGYGDDITFDTAVFDYAGGEHTLVLDLYKDSADVSDKNPLTVSRNINIQGPVNNGKAYLEVRVPATGAEGAQDATRSRVFTVNGAADSAPDPVKVTLGNLILSGGKVAEGGALYVDGKAEVTLDNVTVSSSAADSGGGIYLGSQASIVRLENAAIKDNRASGSGGGLYAANGAAVETDGTVFEETAPATAGP